jgi:Holliday junction resolvasome RuvABC ATP-dependent DNA helicase subunit
VQMISVEEKNAMNLARESEGVPHIALSMLK